MDEPVHIPTSPGNQNSYRWEIYCALYEALQYLRRKENGERETEKGDRRKELQGRMKVYASRKYLFDGSLRVWKLEQAMVADKNNGHSIVIPGHSVVIRLYQQNISPAVRDGIMEDQ